MPFQSLMYNTLLERFFSNYRRDKIYKAVYELRNSKCSDRVTIFMSDMPPSKQLTDYTFEEVYFKDLDLDLLRYSYDYRFIVFYIGENNTFATIKNVFAFNGMSGTLKSSWNAIDGWLIIVPVEVEILGRLSNSYTSNIHILHTIFAKIHSQFGKCTKQPYTPYVHQESIYKVVERTLKTLKDKKEDECQKS